MNDEGGVEKIDLEKVDWRGSREFFESLGEALDKLDDKDESYDFTWVGKRKSIIEAGAPINKTFRPDVEASKNWDTTENLFIEGDNLDALKLLQESYLGKVKMIYIDPPYNTGKDFVYRDNFKANVEQYDEDTEYKDDEGNIQFKKNEKSNGRYHSDWLSMMYPRLKLARNLLSEDGVIFISIDDNEQANLKKLCDEVFGEDNFINSVAVNMSNMSGPKIQHAITGKRFPKIKEYILLYAKSSDKYRLRIPKTPKEKWDPEYNLIVPNFTKELSESFESGDTISNPNELVKDLELVSLKKFMNSEGITEDDDEWKFENSYRIFASKPNTALLKIAREKDDYQSDIYVLENSSEQLKLITTKFNRESRTARIELVSALSKAEVFYGDQWGDIVTTGGIAAEGGVPYPNAKKPLKLMERLIYASNVKDGDIVFDFFAGSASTGHALMKYCHDNQVKASYIMVQLDEDLDESLKTAETSAKRDIKLAIDFLDSIGKPHYISEIAMERLRRAGVKFGKAEGFRVLRIADTNHKDVYRPAADYQQSMLDELVDNVKEDRSDLDLLYGVLTATAWELNKPLETVELDGAAVYKYDYFGEVSGLVACFADAISEEAIKQIAQLKPLTAVFKESSFPNSQAKVNLAEHFRIISSDTKVKVI